MADHVYLLGNRYIAIVRFYKSFINRFQTLIHTNKSWLQVTKIVLMLDYYRISGISFTFHVQRDAPMYTKLEWLFSWIFLFTLRAQCDAPSYTKLEWLFYRIFCSLSVHDVTLGRIHRLPTSVGLAQARPN